MLDKLKAFKDKVLDFVDAVKADPKKQLIFVFAAGVVSGFILRGL
jgi:hypothetical protein